MSNQPETSGILSLLNLLTLPLTFPLTLIASLGETKSAAAPPPRNIYPSRPVDTFKITKEPDIQFGEEFNERASGKGVRVERLNIFGEDHSGRSSEGGGRSDDKVARFGQ